MNAPAPASFAYDRAVERFYALHDRDPRLVLHEGQSVPFSVVYHDRVRRFVDALEAQPSEAVRLAAACQHVERFTLPRTNYPEGVLGYKKWRTALSFRHAEVATRVLLEVGYSEAEAEVVADLVKKKNLRSDPDAKLLEDAVCLAFLEGEFEDFAAKHPADKVIDIVQKTWAKMTPRGHTAALELAGSLSEAAQNLLTRALSPHSPPDSPR